MKNLPPRLPYTEIQDRHWQGDAQRWAEILQDSHTRFIAFWGSKAFLKEEDGKYAPCLLYKQELGLVLDDQTLVYLGKEDNHHLVGIGSEEKQASYLAEKLRVGAWMRARSLFGALSPQNSSLLAYCSGMLYWRGQQRFCGHCGATTVPQPAGRIVDCSGCGKIYYPRINPAVIMLIESENERGEPVCLLSRHHRTPEGMMTTLAGFVEVGETLEQAVIREVWEETQVEVTEVSYITSQPWPFPSSLMMGFRGKAIYAEPKIDHLELIEARWFTRKELQELVETEELQPSRIDSIARFLIMGWLG